MKDSIFRHIFQNAFMAIPMIRIYAKRWHNTGMGRSGDRILPVLKMIVEMLDVANTDFTDKAVLELGPGQTPDILFAALLFGAQRAVGLDIKSYVKKDFFRVSTYEETRIWINEAILNGELQKTQEFDDKRFLNKSVISKKHLDILLYDGERFPFEDKSIDIILSRSVLEHVKNYGSIIKEMKRVLKPEGLTCHIIDLRDHSTLENGKDWLRFLTYRDALWNLMMSNRTCWTNRLRASQWERIFKAASFNLIYKNTEVLPFHEDFNKEKLILPFRKFKNEELGVAWLNIAHKNNPISVVSG